MLGYWGTNIVRNRRWQHFKQSRLQKAMVSIAKYQPHKYRPMIRKQNVTAQHRSILVSIALPSWLLMIYQSFLSLIYVVHLTHHAFLFAHVTKLPHCQEIHTFAIHLPRFIVPGTFHPHNQSALKSAQLNRLYFDTICCSSVHNGIGLPFARHIWRPNIPTYAYESSLRIANRLDMEFVPWLQYWS